MEPAIQMKGITKKFPGGVIANDHVDFLLQHQEIHCLLGENGSGKTTLMNALFGLYKIEEGIIEMDGKPVHMNNPKAALDAGLGMVHQHFMLVNRMSVLENIILGHELGNVIIDMKRNYRAVEELSKKYGFGLDLNARVEDLSVGMRQRVEILKTLYRGAEVIILDEPTAVLTPPEVDELFIILRELKEKGKSIIFITHKLNETIEIADHITVLRKGKNVISMDKKQATPELLAKYMVGRDVNFNLEKLPPKLGERVLDIKDLQLFSKAKETISFDVHAGEIVGIAGVEGNGQLELEELLMGFRKNNHGNILLSGTDITEYSTKSRKRMGIGYIPSDRHKRAMMENMTLWENTLLGYQSSKEYSKRGIIKKGFLKEHCNSLIKKFNIKAENSDEKIKALSGGNQQKVILAREVSHEPVLLIAAQPIRGLDIGAIEYIHRLLVELRDEGKAILLISAELSEIMKLSDRIAVFYEGEIRAFREAKSFDREEIGLLMAGKEMTS